VNGHLRIQLLFELLLAWKAKVRQITRAFFYWMSCHVVTTEVHAVRFTAFGEHLEEAFAECIALDCKIAPRSVLGKRGHEKQKERADYFHKAPFFRGDSLTFPHPASMLTASPSE
jgi:hypothetical protein